MANQFYNQAKKKLMQGSFVLDSDTIKVMILSSSYTPNIDTDTFKSDISANEVSGTGYTAGGTALASKTITVDTTNDLAYFDAADVSLAGLTIVNGRYLVVYKDTGTPSTSPLLFYDDMGGNKSPTGDTFTIVWDANGLCKLT